MAGHLAVHTGMSYALNKALFPTDSPRLAIASPGGSGPLEIKTEGTIMDAKSGASTQSGQLTVGNKSWSFPIYDGSIGPSVMDIGKLYAQTGMFTYDPGYTSTGSCESKITYIDG